MTIHTSDCFLLVLSAKRIDHNESIADATARLLKTKQIILVKRNKRFIYIQPHTLRDGDVVQELGQKDRSEPQNEIAVNSPDKTSNSNNANKTKGGKYAGITNNGGNCGGGSGKIGGLE